jgi:hypothetical protein
MQKQRWEWSFENIYWTYSKGLTKLVKQQWTLVLGKQLELCIGEQDIHEIGGIEAKELFIE